VSVSVAYTRPMCNFKMNSFWRLFLIDLDILVWITATTKKIKISMIVFKLNCFIIYIVFVFNICWIQVQVQYMLVNVCLGLNMLCCIVIIVSEKMEETNNCIHLYTKKYVSINIVFTIVNRCHRCTISL
jgi:hypothetical protein